MEVAERHVARDWKVTDWGTVYYEEVQVIKG
jgi:hypothetical protein